jgi:hypothetical protein
MCRKCVSSAIRFNLLLLQLMWAYAAASCPMPHLTHAAAATCATSCIFKYKVRRLVSCCACCFAVTQIYVLLLVAPFLLSSFAADVGVCSSQLPSATPHTRCCCQSSRTGSLPSLQQQQATVSTAGVFQGFGA